MTDRVVTLRVEARVDGERPELCSWSCPFICHPHSVREVARCDLFDDAPLEADTSRISKRELRCPACLSAEQDAPDVKP